MPHNSRIRALSLAVALVGLPAVTAQAEDLKPLTVVLSYVPSVESFGSQYALSKGFFKDEGLDVTITPAGMGVDQVQMVSSGLATIGIVGPEMILAAEDKGEHFKVFGAEFQSTPMAMTCRQDSGVKKPADLIGKKLGVKQGGASYADLFLSKNGIAKDKVDISAIGGSDISQIMAGKIDCMITTFAFNEPRQISDAGVPVNVIKLGDYGMNAQQNSYFVSADFYAKPDSKDILARYLRAELKAWEEFFKNPEAAAEFMVEGGFHDGLDLDQQKYQAKEQVKFMTSALTAEKGLFWVDPKTWEETAQNALTVGQTSKLVDTTPILTTEILDMVAPAKH